MLSKLHLSFNDISKLIMCSLVINIFYSPIGTIK